jgi:hypothetical protein
MDFQQFEPHFTGPNGRKCHECHLKKSPYFPVLGGETTQSKKMALNFIVAKF